MYALTWMRVCVCIKLIKDISFFFKLNSNSDLQNKFMI